MELLGGALDMYRWQDAKNYLRNQMRSQVNSIVDEHII